MFPLISSFCLNSITYFFRIGLGCCYDNIDVKFQMKLSLVVFCNLFLDYQLLFLPTIYLSQLNPSINPYIFCLISPLLSLQAPLQLLLGDGLVLSFLVCKKNFYDKRFSNERRLNSQLSVISFYEYIKFIFVQRFLI